MKVIPRENSLKWKKQLNNEHAFEIFFSQYLHLKPYSFQSVYIQVNCCDQTINLVWQIASFGPFSLHNLWIMMNKKLGLTRGKIKFILLSYVWKKALNQPSHTHAHLVNKKKESVSFKNIDIHMAGKFTFFYRRSWIKIRAENITEFCMKKGGEKWFRERQSFKAFFLLLVNPIHCEKKP